VGEMAKQANINPKTLRYYDEIGLLKPAKINRETGYRYYTEGQRLLLHNILHLREMQIPIEKIKIFLSNKSLNDVLTMFNEQKKIADEMIFKLQNIRYHIDRNIEYFNLLVNNELTPGVVSVKEIAERKALVMEGRTKENEYYIGLHEKLCKEVKINLVDFSWGQLGRCMSMNLEESKEYTQYHKVFIVYDDLSGRLEDSSYYKALPQGTYLSIYVDKYQNNTAEMYHRLVQFCREEHYRMMDDAFEIALSGPEITSDSKKYVSEIQILVEKE
jgi:DNA-binding transcriptional MerR regulator